MITQKDIKLLGVWEELDLSAKGKARKFVELSLVEKLREQLKGRARDINKFGLWVNVKDVDDVFGVEAKK